MKYDIIDKINKLKGFYEWNKNHYITNKDDERYKKHQKFKKKHGFYPDECWSFYNSICIFIIPRLKYMKDTVKKLGCHPCCIDSNEEWIKILDKMIFAFEEANKDETLPPKKYYKDYKKYKKMLIDEQLEADKKARELYYKDINDGLQLFATYFFDLWW